MKVGQPFTSFRREVEKRLRDILDGEERLLNSASTLKIDLHCHDHFSDHSVEVIPGLLKAVDSYTPTEELLRCQKENGMDAFVITNQSQGRSCFDLREKGMDVLTGACFLVNDPVTGFDAQVLVYGFSPIEEILLNKKCRDLSAFVDYTREHDLPTVLAHPLKIADADRQPPPLFFDRLALHFDLFEVMNGNTDLYHSLMTAEWVKSLTPDKIRHLSEKTGIRPDRFARRPFEKKMVGGSDDRVGLLSGSTYTLVDSPEPVSGKEGKKSERILAGLRQGRVAPGGFFERELLHPVSLLVYFLDIAIDLKEPGLTRIFFGQGTRQEKTLAFLIWNLIFEAQSFPFGRSILKVLRKAFSGKRPGLLLRAFLPAPFRGFLEEIDALARARLKPERLFRESLLELFPRLSEKASGLIKKDLEKIFKEVSDTDFSLSENRTFSFMDLPAALRSLGSTKGMGQLKTIFQTLGKAGGAFKEIRLPVGVSALLAGASFASASLLSRLRPFEESFAVENAFTARPKQLLWITDTFHDQNGVSRFLSSFHQEAVHKNLPVDFLIASNQMKSGPHLLALKPFLEFTLEKYHDQPIRLPDLLEVHRLFSEGAYDRLLLSTEGPLGMAALFFKYAFHLPISFYMHTDWLDFARKTLHFDEASLEKLERMLRAGYGLFDRVFVLNREHEAWLRGSTMELPAQKVSLTAHWADDFFVPREDERVKRFGVAKEDPVFLYAGRISREKGVFEIPELMKAVKAVSPKAKMIFAGKGPAMEELKELLPDALFLGWVDARELPAIYSSADLLLMPSQFDTFGCVILEALATGLPVLAYESKGPADIIESGKSGYLAADANEMKNQAVRWAGDIQKLRTLRENALERSRAYAPDKIIARLLRDVNLSPF